MGRKCWICRDWEIEEVPASVSGLEQVRGVWLEHCSKLVEFTALKQLPALRELNLRWCVALSVLSPLASLPALQTLDLSRGYKVSNLLPLTSLTALQSLGFSGMQRAERPVTAGFADHLAVLRFERVQSTE